MNQVTITVDKEELAIIQAAITHYRLAGFPLGKSSYGRPIGHRDRQGFAAQGMKLWTKLMAVGKEGKKVIQC